MHSIQRTRQAKASLLLIIWAFFQLTGCTAAARQAWAARAQQEFSGRGSSTASPSQNEIALGLKSALEIGASLAAQRLSVQDGYFSSPWKILLPEEAQKATDKLRAIPGYNQLEDDLVRRLNRAAEDAATRAQPVFVEAIQSMSIADAQSILLGAPNAATQYLERTTQQKLFEAFLPVIQRALDVVNARTLWREAATRYNAIPLVTPVNPSLDNHVTVMALKGLFALVAEKE